MPGDNVTTGCRVRLMLNGTKIGYATGVTIRESIAYEPINVLDNIATKEHVPVGYTCSMTAETIRIVGSSLKKAGYFPKQGTSSADFLRNIVTNGEMTGGVYDSISRKLIQQVEGVKISEQSVNYTARGVTGQSVSMVAIRARDEADISPT